MITIRDIVKKRFKKAKGLECTLITMSIRDKTWNDFTHSKIDRVLFSILRLFLKPY